MKYVFIANPIAGNKSKEKLFSLVKSTFRLIDDEMVIEETQKPGDAKEISERYAKEYGADCVIVACGGDGTIHEVANGLSGTETALMVLPMGTGNDFAKKIYNTRSFDIEKIMRTYGFFDGYLRYHVKPIDLIDYNGEKCINVMSFGLDTKVETIGRKIATKAPFLGKQAYNIAIVPVISKPLHYNISYDLVAVDKETGERFRMREDDKDYSLFAICNASFYGGSYCPAPNSKLDDGLLDYALLDGTKLSKVVDMIPRYSKGTLNDENGKGIFHTGYLESGKFWMSDGSTLLGNCDGENFNYKELEFKVLHNNLKLCIPITE